MANSPIWMLTTKGRPQGCQDVLDACEETGMTSPGIVWVDETVDEYRTIRLPANWKIMYRRRWGGIAAGMRWCLKNYPDASQYGWLADDSFPKSPIWDQKIEQAAGEWLLASGQDRWVSLTPEWKGMLHTGQDFGAPMCWGGKLVRAVGWWALPGVRQAGIDTAWSAIVHHLGLHTYIPEVICEHHNYRTGKRAQDATDSWFRNGVNYIQEDIETRNLWASSDDFQATIERVVGALAAEGKEPPRKHSSVSLSRSRARRRQRSL